MLLNYDEKKIIANKKNLTYIENLCILKIHRTDM